MMNGMEAGKGECCRQRRITERGLKVTAHGLRVLTHDEIFKRTHTHTHTQWEPDGKQDKNGKVRVG